MLRIKFALAICVCSLFATIAANAGKDNNFQKVDNSNNERIDKLIQYQLENLPRELEKSVPNPLIVEELIGKHNELITLGYIKSNKLDMSLCYQDCDDDSCDSWSEECPNLCLACCCCLCTCLSRSMKKTKREPDNQKMKNCLELMKSLHPDLRNK